MTKLKKQIVEEAKKILFKANKLPPEANYFGSVDHIKYSSNEILKLSEELELSSRWRKVSEELPELGVEVLITRNDGIRFLSWLDKDSELFFNVSGNEEYFLDEILSWKPID